MREQQVHLVTNHTAIEAAPGTEAISKLFDGYNAHLKVLLCPADAPTQGRRRAPRLSKGEQS